MATTQHQAARFTCPMHPEVQQDHPGNCPKCGMALVPSKKEGGGAAKHDGEDQDQGAREAGSHEEMVRQMRAPWLWTNFTIIALGLWLASSPFTFGYLGFDASSTTVAQVTAERGLPSAEARGAVMAWNDCLSGILLVFFAALALWPYPRTDFWGRWGVCFIGIWLQFAPLLLWSPSPAAYVNDTLIGTFAIALSVLVPMMPGMAHHMVMMQPGPEVPPGWTYNPSSWHQRAPLIGLAIIGWFISRYLAAVQLGYIETAWEPFFGEGTQRVLHSDVSLAWPISDAGFGAAAYTFEALMGFMGMKSRWRTMPWMVTFFGILVVPLGATHLILVVLQPVMVGHWCTLCLAAAVIMLAMVPLAVDEVVAMCQFLVRAVREGRPFWRTFWVGGTLPETNEDQRTPRFGSPVAPMIPAMVWGVSLPWPLVVGMGLGAWLMVAPDVFGIEKPAADSSRLAGALVVTTAAVATAEVTRAARFFNILLGIWIIGAPWLMAGDTALGTASAVVVGVTLILVSLPRGLVRERYGGWDRYVV